MFSIPSFNRTIALLVVVLSVGIVTLISIYQSNSSDHVSVDQVPSAVLDVSDSQLSSEESPQELASVSSDDVLGYQSKVGELPKSFTGTRLMQGLHVDEDGHLRLSGDIRDVFDYFLAGISEEPIEIILSRIDEYLEYHLSEPALGEAKEILAQYIALKSALYDLEKSMADHLPDLQNGSIDQQAYLALLREQLDMRNQLRAENLDPQVHEAFYAEQEQYDEYSYSRLMLMANSDLSENDKQKRLSELEQTLPEHIVADMRESELSDTLKAETQKIIASGGSREEVRGLRREMFGDEAVERFDELDAQRADWQQRIEHYMHEKEQLVQLEGITELEKQSQIDQLRAQHFDAREQIRVQVYERAGS